MIAQAGLPLVDSLRDLTREQLHQYQKFHNIDPPRDFMELPCWSWELPEGGMMECYHLLGKRNRGEITPEEHRRRVREACGLPPEEPSSSGDSAGSSPAPAYGSSSGAVITCERRMPIPPSFRTCYTHLLDPIRLARMVNQVEWLM